MKKMVGVAAVGALVAVFVAVMPVLGSGEKGQFVCPCPYHPGCGVLKDAKIAVQNTDQGVTVSITAETPEKVKAIQAAFTEFSMGTNMSCQTMTAETCEKAPATSGCPRYPPTTASCHGLRPGAGNR